MASNDPPPAKRAKTLREGRLENKVVFITAAAQGIGRASVLVSRSDNHRHRHSYYDYTEPC